MGKDKLKKKKKKKMEKSYYRLFAVEEITIISEPV